MFGFFRFLLDLYEYRGFTPTEIEILRRLERRDYFRK